MNIYIEYINSLSVVVFKDQNNKNMSRGGELDTQPNIGTFTVKC